MTTRELRILLVLLIPLSMIGNRLLGKETSESKDINIYLPRERVVTTSQITLEDVIHLSGRDYKLIESIRNLPMGRAPFPGESFMISRNTIIARLAGQKIPSRLYRLLGAQKTCVRRDSQTFSGDDFANAATEHLKGNFRAEGIDWKLSRKPKALHLPKTGKVSLLCNIDPKSPQGILLVHVSAFNAQKKIIGSRTVTFKLTYRAYRVIATQDIPLGETITKQNVRIEAYQCNTKPSGRFEAPYGWVAKHTIQKGAKISTVLLKRPKPILLAKRNKSIRIKINGKGWKITTVGIALENGYKGDTVRVRNIRSKKVIYCQIDSVGDAIPVKTLR